MVTWTSSDQATREEYERLLARAREVFPSDRAIQNALGVSDGTVHRRLVEAKRLRKEHVWALKGLLAEASPDPEDRIPF